MKLYPAIDLMNGQVVRLAQGRFQDKTTYQQLPLETAQRFAAAGATYLHVVDLDGARQGRPAQLELIQTLAESTGLQLQAGGGVRSLTDVQSLLNAGVDRIIIGSLAVTEAHLTEEIFRSVGGNRLTLGLDLGLNAAGTLVVATHGWQKLSDMSVDAVLERYLKLGLSQILCTDISRDGMMKGPNFELYRQLRAQYPELCILASGGMHRLEDIQQLKQDQIGGAIIGRALYEGTIDLKEALLC